MTKIQQILFENQDKEYASFQARLTPGICIESFIGVRVPKLRKIAKDIVTNSDIDLQEFLENLPHKYYDENMLHSILISQMKDYENVVAKIEKFLPYIDNWAVCDILNPKIFKKHKKELFERIKIWTNSDKTYTIRFGIEMLMIYFLDEDFNPRYLEIPASVKNCQYYVKMMIAWFFAESLVKHWDDTIVYLESHKLYQDDFWVHNKTIQKALESYRIDDAKKTYLRSLKVKK
ncbi:MAG: DNA alkylation repair protein [Treponemataceae bacterium]